MRGKYNTVQTVQYSTTIQYTVLRYSRKYCVLCCTLYSHTIHITCIQLLLGTGRGVVSFFDSDNSKFVWEVNSESRFPR